MQQPHPLHNKTQATNHKRHRSYKRPLFIGLGVLLISICGIGSWYVVTYQDSVYPGITVAGQSVSGLTNEALKNKLQSAGQSIVTDGITVQLMVEGTAVAVTIPAQPSPGSTNATNRPYFSLDVDATAQAAFAIGRSGSWWDQTTTQWNTVWEGVQVPMQTRLDRDGIEQMLRDTFSEYETPAQDANITFAETGTMDIIPEHGGEELNYSAIVDQIDQHIKTLNNEPIIVELQPTKAEFTSAEIEDHRSEIEDWLSHEHVTLTWEDQSWDIDRNQISQWLAFTDGALTVDPKRLRDSEPATELIGEIETKPTEARWSVVTNDEGKLTDLTALNEATAGREIDMDQTAERIQAVLSQHTDEEVEIAITSIDPTYTNESIADSGIKDLLGTGHSNMAGSPYNRQLNIERGVELLNGLIIEPGEEFSLNAALRPYDAENGYYQELVIAGNQTIPEYGGGLCQVGTTLFRAAMNAGLDITERSGHAYAVSYYFDERNQLPGTDATIYDQVADLKYINDTKHPILLQTRIEGTDLYFDMWGVSDGRQGSYSAPTISGWVAPPAPKEIETTDLAPGEKVCTESAHSGTSASFTYTIKRSDGSEHSEDFNSYYQPWQAVCKVGKQPDPEPEETPEDVENDKETTVPTTDTQTKKSTTPSTDTKKGNKKE